ncbi:MAG: radical SAM protein [Deltaproteobacteria bacterium]|nr:radical SAM protein [Deltaproteobacteria bacterium]
MSDERAPATERVDIKTGWNCNNRCVFCVQGNKREKFGNKETAEVRRLLEEARRDSDAIVFTGGEVTVRRDLIEIVRYAKELGYRSIQIQTNGRMLAYRKLCEDLIAAGANEFSPALHGHVPELHDMLTRASGSFVQTVRSIRNLKDLGQNVLTNTVVTRSNYRNLPEIAGLLVSLGVDQYQFAFVHPLGSAGEDFVQVVPRHSLAEPYVKAGLSIGIRAGRRVMTEAIPYCFMEGFEPWVAERIIPRTKIFEGHVTIKDYTEHRLTEGKAKRPECRECAFDPVCEGPWREYPEHYGWDEFVPRKDFSRAHPDALEWLPKAPC